MTPQPQHRREGLQGIRVVIGDQDAHNRTPDDDLWVQFRKGAQVWVGVARSVNGTGRIV